MHKHGESEAVGMVLTMLYLLVTLLNNKMNIVAHIPFFGPNLEKFKILRKTIKSLKTLSKNVEIFVHTHNNFLNNKKISSKIIIHKLSPEDLNRQKW